ncbi:aminotransferase class IV [bacterium]|nr:aminotransferase class IV [bacterium]
MAGFEGTKWAAKQLKFLLKDDSVDILPGNSRVPAVSRSIHYGLFLAFEGIRFYCIRNSDGGIEVNFLNLDKNLKRLCRSISFNLSAGQQHLVPTVERLEEVFMEYFHDPQMIGFLSQMADSDAQGYLRPFTFDEAESIGVTFPENPSIRAVVCRYDRYLGEPFSGVVIPTMVRAIGINGTGCLKLGINYLMSVKAVDRARQIYPAAGSALFLDDRPHEPLDSRNVSEWDSSCCLIGLRDNTVIKIPESNLILPSVTIQGICAILGQKGVTVDERDFAYGEMRERAAADDIVAICSIGTAGILNRAEKLVLTDNDGRVIGEQKADPEHELYGVLGECRTYYWDIYREKEQAPDGVALQKFRLNP